MIFRFETGSFQQGRTECGAHGALAPGARKRGRKIGFQIGCFLGLNLIKKKRWIVVYFEQRLDAVHTLQDSNPELSIYIEQKGVKQFPSEAKGGGGGANF